MNIAGVSVDIDNLPKREVVFTMALSSVEFYLLENKEDLINQILDNSGYWSDEEVILNKKEDVLPRVDEKTFRKNKR